MVESSPIKEEKHFITEDSTLVDGHLDEESRPVNAAEDSQTGQHEDIPPAEVHYDELPQGRQLGTISAIFLMVNRILGTGVFSTTSTILQQGGSVGMSLILSLIHI